MNTLPVAGRRATVLVADDRQGMVDELCRMLRPQFDIVGTASDGKSALAAVLELQPDIVLLDIEMPLLDGIRVSHEIRKQGISSRVVFVTMHQDADYISHAFETGASGYVFKSHLSCDLLPALEAVMAARTFVSLQTAH